MKKFVELICAGVLCISLAGCASDDNSSSQTDSADESVKSTYIPTDNIKQIRAKITGYKDGKLSFVFKDKEYTLPMSDTLFDETSHTYPRDEIHEATLSERIINNRFGCEITGRLTVLDDMSAIIICDVLSLNIQIYTGSEAGVKVSPDGNRVRNLDYIYSFRKTSPNKCIISNLAEALEFDLNDLPRFMKLRYADKYDSVYFMAAKFKTGDMILLSCFPEQYSEELNTLVTSANFLRPEPEEPVISYFGTVKYVDDGQAQVLLNDGKTTLKVPTCFNDGEVERDMKVLVQTNSLDDYLYGSGGTFELSDVIIFTKERLFNPSGYEFAQLAYCFIPPETNGTYSTPYIYITKDQAESK